MSAALFGGRFLFEVPMSATSLTPHLVVHDAEAGIAFYRNAFDATLREKHPAEDGKRLMHVHLIIGSSPVFLHDEFPEFGGRGARSPKALAGTSCTLHLEVADADDVWHRAVNAGAVVLMPLENQFWGMRYGQLEDPFGHVWSIGGPVK